MGNFDVVKTMFRRRPTALVEISNDRPTTTTTTNDDCFCFTGRSSSTTDNSSSPPWNCFFPFGFLWKSHETDSRSDDDDDENNNNRTSHQYDNDEDKKTIHPFTNASTTLFFINHQVPDSSNNGAFHRRINDTATSYTVAYYSPRPPPPAAADDVLPTTTNRHCNMDGATTTNAAVAYYSPRPPPPPDDVLPTSSPSGQQNHDDGIVDDVDCLSTSFRPVARAKKQRPSFLENERILEGILVSDHDLNAYYDQETPKTSNVIENKREKTRALSMNLRSAHGSSTAAAVVATSSMTTTDGPFVMTTTSDKENSQVSSHDYTYDTATAVARSTNRDDDETVEAFESPTSERENQSFDMVDWNRPPSLLQSTTKSDDDDDKNSPPADNESPARNIPTTESSALTVNTCPSFLSDQTLAWSFSSSDDSDVSTGGAVAAATTKDDNEDAPLLLLEESTNQKVNTTSELRRNERQKPRVRKASGEAHSPFSRKRWKRGNGHYRRPYKNRGVGRRETPKTVSPNACFFTNQKHFFVVSQSSPTSHRPTSPNECFVSNHHTLVRRTSRRARGKATTSGGSSKKQGKAYYQALED